DQTPFLSREEVRILSAIPADYATNSTKIRLGLRMAENIVKQILNRLIASGLVEVVEGWQGDRLYRMTAAGSKHPQRKQSARWAEAARLAVESDRVHRVLSAIADSGAMRIREVTEALSVPHQSINALMQYLKRKHLVRKTGQEFHAPYCLTN